MKESKIKNIYNQKINLIKKYNQNYYDKNKPSVTDQVYDNLKDEILKLENEYSFLESKFSPSISVGFKPSKTFKKFPHRSPMLSLANAFTEEDLINFEKKIINYLSEKKKF